MIGLSTFGERRAARIANSRRDDYEYLLIHFFRCSSYFSFVQSILHCLHITGVHSSEPAASSISSYCAMLYRLSSLNGSLLFQLKDPSKDCLSMDSNP